MSNNLDMDAKSVLKENIEHFQSQLGEVGTRFAPYVLDNIDPEDEELLCLQYEDFVMGNLQEHIESYLQSRPTSKIQQLSDLIQFNKENSVSYTTHMSSCSSLI